MTALSAHALRAAYHAKRISPVDIIQAALTKINEDSFYNAWVHIAAEASLDAARAAESRWFHGEPLGPLDGIPIGIKDLIAVAGQPMRRGSPAYPANFTPAEDAPIIARLREAGAILLGKTATPDAGCKLDTTSLVHGTTRNPFDKNLTAGGSSGGSAVALALGHVPIAIGTDGAGSIRVPAACCGLFGLKPSTGRIPTPPGPFWPHAVTGPMCRNVSDTALAWNIATRPDAGDPYALPFLNRDWTDILSNGAKGLRIAVAETFSATPVSADVKTAIGKAAALLSRAGAIVEAAEPEFSCNPHDPFMVFWRCMYAQSVAMMPPEQAAQIDPVIANIVAAAKEISRADFQNAIQQRDMMAQTMSRFHASYDLLLCPMLPCPPWQAGRATPAPYAPDDWSWFPFAYIFNMTRQPAASVPIGFDANGLPLAVQLVAAAGKDGMVFRAAATLEGAA